MDARYSLAPKGMRFLAYALDYIFLQVVQALGSFLGGFIAAFVLSAQQAPYQSVEDASRVGALFGLFFWNLVGFIVNYGVLQGTTGASLGKLITRLRVVSTEGERLGVMRSLWRSALYVVSVLPFGIGFLAIFWTKNQQCFHDSIAGTVVIRAPRKKMPIALPAPEEESQKAA